MMPAESMSVAVRYWIASDQGSRYPELSGIDDFRAELAEHYVAVVLGRPSGAGGVVHIIIEAISTISLRDVANLVAGGLAYDVIKEGGRSFVLRPLLSAFSKLRKKNQDRVMRLWELAIQFQDCRLVIRDNGSTAIENLPRVFARLSQDYGEMALWGGDSPSEIRIPVVEDPDRLRPCRFRELDAWEEPLGNQQASHYLGYWGVVYAYDQTIRVFDVHNRCLLDERFHTVEQRRRDMTDPLGRRHRQRQEQGSEVRQE